MKRFLLALALCGLVIAPAYSQNTALRLFIHGEKELTDSSWALVSHNVFSNFTEGNDVWAYLGISRRFSKGSVGFFGGHSFLPGKDNSPIVDCRAFYSLNKMVCIWGMVDYYPKWESIYVEGMIELAFTKGIEIGVEGSAYSQSGRTNGSAGPNLNIEVTKNMGLDITQQWSSSAGDDFTRATIFLKL